MGLLDLLDLLEWALDNECSIGEELFFPIVSCSSLLQQVNPIRNDLREDIFFVFPWIPRLLLSVIGQCSNRFLFPTVVAFMFLSLQFLFNLKDLSNEDVLSYWISPSWIRFPLTQMDYLLHKRLRTLLFPLSLTKSNQKKSCSQNQMSLDILQETLGRLIEQKCWIRSLDNWGSIYTVRCRQLNESVTQLCQYLYEIKHE